MSLRGQKFFVKRFARVSPVFLALACVSFGAAELRALNSADTPGTSVKRQAASAQYAKAEEQRAALNGKTLEKRTLADYRTVVSAYHRVTLITPKAPEVVDSLLAIAELYTEMGERFGRSYNQSAVDTYLFLAEEYPASRYCPDAMLRAAKLQREQLGDSEQASKTYEEFLKRYPRSQRKREAQEALAELALLRNSETPDAANTAPAMQSVGPAMTAAQQSPVQEPAPVRSLSGGSLPQRDDSESIPRIRRIRANGDGNSTRVTIDLEDSVEYTSARLANPDRIFFDLHAARLTPEVARGNVKVDGDLLRAVRVAQNQTGVVRVVLDVNGVKDYSASLTNNPPQLVIDLYANAAPSTPMRTAKSKRTQHSANPVEAADNSNPVPAEKSAAQLVSAKTAAADAELSAAAKSLEANNALRGSLGGNAGTAVVKNTTPGAKAARSKSVSATKTNTKPDLIQAAAAPQPTHDGGATLIRTLGLKIGRIVIDPGHGGHDTGTIGPTGLMEKDLCLDVALRLGKIIQQRLPGADVVYTRSDDTFVPLEERTNLANQARADLFISIHANSSEDHAARGIETYYLNLKGSPEAMAVAARENTASQEGIHDLQDVVKKIAQTEKIDESKEFAEDIQDSLSRRIQKNARTVKNRGVRKAPFVVLIGADMPSVLTEISFLSNPADEQLLKKPEQRQRVAEGLYQGVASYLQSLNSVTMNQPPKLRAGRPTTPPVEQSRNQQ